MPVPHRPARPRPRSARRLLGAATLLVPAVAVLAPLSTVSGSVPTGTAARAAAPATTSATTSAAAPSSSTTTTPATTTTTAAAPTFTTTTAPSTSTPAKRTPPTADVPCPTATRSAGRAPTSCDEPAADADPPRTRCHRKTVEVLARAGDTRRLVVEGSLTLRWCSQGTRLILRTTASFGGEARDGLAIAVARRPQIRHRGRAADVADVRFRVTGKPRADVYAATTPEAVLRSRRRVLAGRRVDQRLTLRLSVEAGGRASARCTGALVACRVTPADR